MLRHNSARHRNKSRLLKALIYWFQSHCAYHFLQRVHFNPIQIIRSQTVLGNVELMSIGNNPATTSWQSTGEATNSVKLNADHNQPFFFDPQKYLYHLREKAARNSKPNAIHQSDILTSVDRLSKPTLSTGAHSARTIDLLMAYQYKEDRRAKSARNSRQRRKGSTESSSGDSGPPGWQVRAASAAYSSPRSARRKCIDLAETPFPWLPGLNRSYLGVRSMSPTQVDGMVGRVTKPTVASRGGVDLAEKEFVYIIPPRVKTNIIIPGLDKRFQCKRTVNDGELGDIVGRLTKSTYASVQQAGPDIHTWPRYWRRTDANRFQKVAPQYSARPFTAPISPRSVRKEVYGEKWHDSM